MLGTSEALQKVLSATTAFPDTIVPADQCAGRVLRQTICAERDQPPFDRVMMDGIALSWKDYSSGQRAFLVQATLAAGDPPISLNDGGCIEIMTGATRPGNADCIVPVEHIRVTDGVATIDTDYDVREGRFIHPRGSDFARDAQLLKPGKRIAPTDIAVIASCGYTEVAVASIPTVRVVSTGNELVPAGQVIEDHQIRMSNGPAIVSLLGQHGYRNCEHDHIPDDKPLLRSRLAEHLAQADVLLLSGGVSMGKADFIPQILAELGVDVVFHKVSQRPGKPMWFGLGPNDQLVFALPGNPVSALVCCRQYVVPALARASGNANPPPEFAALASNVSFKPALTCFQPVRLTSNTSGQVIAIPVKTNTSGDFAALSGTDGYVELPKDQTRFDAGTSVFLYRWIAA